MQSASGTQPPSPGDMQSKIDSLIAGEVSNGKLTSAQADELKNVFAKAFKGGPHGAGGPPAGGPGGAGGDADGDATAAQQRHEFESARAAQRLDNSKLAGAAGFPQAHAELARLLGELQHGGNSLASQIQSLLVNYQA